MLHKGQLEGQLARTDQLEALSESAKLSTDILKSTTKTDFPLLQSKMEPAELYSDIYSDNSDEEEANTQTARKRYKLIHRRFAHYGPQLIRNLHKVLEGIDKVKIPPPDKRICDSCKIGKICKKISKKLEEYKREPL